MDLTISVTIDEQELWDAVAGSGSYYQWFQVLNGLRFGESPRDVKVVAWDPQSPGGDSATLMKIITVKDMALALERLIHKGYSHCGIPFGLNVISDPDSCVADLILQVAVYGDVVYG